MGRARTAHRFAPAEIRITCVRKAIHVRDGGYVSTRDYTAAACRAATFDRLPVMIAQTPLDRNQAGNPNTSEPMPRIPLLVGALEYLAYDEYQRIDQRHHPEHAERARKSAGAPGEQTPGDDPEECQHDPGEQPALRPGHLNDEVRRLSPILVVATNVVDGSRAGDPQGSGEGPQPSGHRTDNRQEGGAPRDCSSSTHEAERGKEEAATTQNVCRSMLLQVAKAVRRIVAIRALRTSRKLETEGEREEQPDGRESDTGKDSGTHHPRLLPDIGAPRGA